MIVLIISAFPPEPASEASHGLHISENLAVLGHTVHVLCKKGSIASTMRNIVVHPVIVDWNWSDLPGLVQCLKESRPDVVLLLYIGSVFNHQPMITFLPTICQKVLPGVPCVTQFENVYTDGSRRTFWARARCKAMALRAGGKDVHWFFGTLLRDSARVISLSSPHRDILVRHYPEAQEKCVILPLPPLFRLCSDPSAVARKRAREAMGIAESEFVWIYWGYIYPGKAVETLLEAFRIACRRNANLRLVLVGGSHEIPHYSGGDYFQMVRGLSETLGVADRVKWTGSFKWDSEEGSLYLHGSDACVLPFDYGMTLNNSSLAAACVHGLPVIGTELVNGRDEMLDHGRNIYLVHPRDPEMLAEAMEVISTIPAFRDRLRSGIGNLARKWYCWETTTKRLVGILESAISGGNMPEPEQSWSDAATKETESSKKRITTEIHPHEGDDALSGIEEDTPHLFSLISSGENILNNITAPLVSVIVTAYNVENYLSQCLDSLVSQTLKNIEIIVVNDASTDKSLTILKEYQKSHNNLVVIDSKNNLGAASARNLGLRAAQGEYIAFTDADDWVDVRMCEVFYKRAKSDDSDVTIANAKVYYEDSKSFGPLFDQHIRKTLNPRLRTMPFELNQEPRILLLESVNWTKLYKRSFLQIHAIKMMDGMSLYEDICFHFSVLVKAERISLIDDELYFYRKNRPGQITTLKTRKLFEVFVVFKKIEQDLTSWNASDEVWEMLVLVQLRIFNWLLRSLVPVHLKREFFADCAKQLRYIPEHGFRKFANRANDHELARAFFMRRNWLRTYNLVNRWPSLPLFYVMLYYRRRKIMNRFFQRFRGMLHKYFISLPKRFFSKLHDYSVLNNHVQAVHNSVSLLTALSSSNLQGNAEKSWVEVCRIHDQKLFLSRAANSNLGDTIWRMQNDYYLTQTAVFREGDNVVDVGAHVGVFSIYLARKYPFIKVYAIEPDPLNYDCLKRNIEINEVTNVTAINQAVSGDGRERTLYVDALDRNWATIEARMVSADRVLRIEQVDTLTLEQLFQEYEIEHCRLLKMTAPGAIKESLQSFTRSGCVDLLCGEADLADCSRVQLEVASWRIARQHFWRTIDRNGDQPVYSWIHQMPKEIERNSSTASLPSLQKMDTNRKVGLIAKHRNSLKIRRPRSIVLSP